MLAYRVTLVADDNATTLVDFPDFPEAHTFGDTKAEALARAPDALETVIAAYMKDRRPIPLPSDGPGARVALPALLAGKIELYMVMISAGVKKAELARRLRWNPPQVDRLLNPRHQSQLKHLEAAAFALDSRLFVSVVRQEATIRRGPGLRDGVRLPRPTRMVGRASAAASEPHRATRKASKKR